MKLSRKEKSILHDAVIYAKHGYYCVAIRNLLELEGLRDADVGHVMQYIERHNHK